MIKIKHLVIVTFAVSIFLALSASAYASSDVYRIEGSDRYKTAVAISKEGWSGGSQYAVIATGEDFPDALSAAPLAKKYDAPILLTQKDSLNTDTSEELKRLKVSRVFIIGGTGVISQGVENDLKSMKISPTRIFGADRFETSVRIAEKVGYKNGVFLTTGYDFSDAVSAAPIAAIKGMPILLTSNGELPSSVSSFLTKRKVSTVYSVGDSYTALPGAESITGYDKYQRNINVIKKFADELNFEKLYVATGRDYPDALAASALAAKTSSALVLTDGTVSSEMKNFIGSRIIDKIYILGGSGAIGSNMESELGRMPARIVSIDEIEDSVEEKKKYEFPKTVKAMTSGGTEVEVPVTWNLATVDTANPGIYTYEGEVEGYDENVILKLEIIPTLSSMQNITAEVVQSETYTFPKAVTAKMSDNTVKDVPVTWNANIVTLNKVGTYSFQGTVPEYNKKVTLTLKVVEDEAIELYDSDFRDFIRKKIGKSKNKTIYKSDILGITELKMEDEDIDRVSGLEYFTNLETLDLSDNNLEDITPLENLTNLKELRLNGNDIVDITPLQKLTKLRYLNLKDNEIEDITPLKNLSNLTTLYLRGNEIEDYSPVKSYYKSLTHEDFDPYMD